MLTIEKLLYIYEAGHVKRWHCEMLIKEEYVSAHSWGVATWIALLHPSPSAALLKAALLHDIAEKKVGDLNRWAKVRFPELAHQVHAAEATVMDSLGVMPTLDPDEESWLKVCDLLDAWLHICYERKLGNTLLDADWLRAYETMRKMVKDKVMSYPTWLMVERLAEHFKKEGEQL